MKKGNPTIWALAVVLIVLTIGLLNNYGFFEGLGIKTITGGVTTVDVTTSAEIANYFAINASTNMSADGIKFDITSLPVINSNATANFDGSSNSSTKLYLSVEVDSNVNVDFCIKANDSLRAGANLIELGNYSWTNSTSTNASLPDIATAVSLTTSFVNSDPNIAGGSSSYHRFWLNVSASQAAGNYINQVNFKGVQTGNSC